MNTRFFCPICRAETDARRTAVEVDGQIGATEWRCSAGHLTVVRDPHAPRPRPSDAARAVLAARRDRS